MKKIIVVLLTCSAFALVANDPPPPVVYTGPATPTSTGAEGYTPGAQTGGATINVIKNFDVNAAQAAYAGNFPDPNYVPVRFDDSTGPLPAAPLPGNTPPPTGTTPPTNTGVCGVPGWGPPFFFACPNGGFSRYPSCNIVNECP